jgi:nucleoside-diphosphate-sugar epimerase
MDLLEELQRAAPPGQRQLDDRTLARLRELTAELVIARLDCIEEYHRFTAVRRRAISPPMARVAAELTGHTIVVTGGSGCVGTALLNQLAAINKTMLLTQPAPAGLARLISVSITPPRRAVPGVEYLTVDVRHQGALDWLFRRYRPGIVFHLAAQRDPGLAERRVVDTLSTNVLGTRNVAVAAERFGLHRLVYASTGKAVRPYTSDVYAGSKRVGEWLMAGVAASGDIACSGVRFTHVVDNSIVLARLHRWCARRDVMRLHAVDSMFYVQSAIESAQLLLTALLAPADDLFRLHVIRDLAWPINLLELALGVMVAERTVAPLYIAGHEPGYEGMPYPGLFDPRYAGDVSPLVNALEAPSAEPSACSEVDVISMPKPRAGAAPSSLLELHRACEDEDDDAARRAHQTINRQLLAATARAAPPTTLRRIIRLTESHRPVMSDEHRLIDDAFRQALASPAPHTEPTEPYAASPAPVAQPPAPYETAELTAGTVHAS